MISIQGLCKTYSSGTQAVKNVSLEVGKGEIFALLGPNGAGKSTTIRALTTLSGFDSGKAVVAGFDVDREPAKVRQAIGYVAQKTAIDYFLTGRENLRLQGQLYRLPKKEIKTRIDELAAYFELTASIDQVVASYSGGMQRKLDIAAALIHRPQVLFLDEPTLGLDTQSRQSLWKYIRKLNEELQLTILLTTHYLEEADRLSNRVGIISGGEIKVVDTPESLKNAIHGDIVTLHFTTVGEQQQNLFWQISQQLFVKGSTWEGNKVHLYVDNGVHAIPAIVNLATAANIDLPHVSFARPSLDDVFIKYTGNSLNASKEESGEKWWEQWAGKGGGSGKWANQWKKWQQNESETAVTQEPSTTSANDSRPKGDDAAAPPQSEQQWQQWQNKPSESQDAGHNPWWPGDKTKSDKSDESATWPKKDWSSNDTTKKE